MDIIKLRIWGSGVRISSGAPLFSSKAPVAQLDRAPDFESGGQGFESLPARQQVTEQQPDCRVSQLMCFHALSIRKQSGSKLQVDLACAVHAPKTGGFTYATRLLFPVFPYRSLRTPEIGGGPPGYWTGHHPHAGLVPGTRLFCGLRKTKSNFHVTIEPRHLFSSS